MRPLATLSNAATTTTIATPTATTTAGAAVPGSAPLRATPLRATLVGATLVRATLIGLTVALLAATAAAQVPEPGPAQPMTYRCESEYVTRVYVDGNQYDWEQEVQPTPRVAQLIEGEFRYDWTGYNDASFMLWCRQTNAALFFAVVARDNQITRPENGRDGDRFQIWFHLDDNQLPAPNRTLGFEIPVWPVLADGSSSVNWAPGQAGRSGQVPASRAELAPRRDGEGYFLEFSIPLSAIGAQIGFAPIRFAAMMRDWDYDTRREQEAVISTSPFNRNNPETWGTLEFGRFHQTLASIRTALSIDSSVEPDLVHWANVAGDARNEFVALLGEHLVVAGEGIPGFSFTNMRIRTEESHTPTELTFANLDPDPELEILYRYRVTRYLDERQMNQEFVAVFDVESDGMSRAAHQETAAEIPGVGRIEAPMELRERGNYTIVRFRRAVSRGLERAQWFDVNAQRSKDWEDMLMPWDSRSKIDYFNTGRGWQYTIE